MNTIVVREVLGRDIFLRPLAHELYKFVDNSTEKTIMDFAGVNFLSRSFLDEFYNLFLKNGAAIAVNLSEDNRIVLETVKSTQNKEKNVKYGEQVYFIAETPEDIKKWLETSPV